MHCCCLQAPRRAAVVQANEELYWQRMSGGIGADMPVLATDAAPRLWSYRHCAEVDGRFFYSGGCLAGRVARIHQHPCLLAARVSLVC